MSGAADRFHRVDAIFDAVLDARREDRAALLHELCGGDAELLVEVESLLRAHDRAGGFLETPALLTSAQLLASAGLDAPAQLGVFRVVREIGRGGMGTVYLGERADGQFEQRVALKLIRHGSAGVVRRFMLERQILARLEHPGIARLIDGGVQDGHPYYAMELVDGEPIDRWCEARALTLEARLSLFLEVCRAISYAHQHLVVHRDLKPSNILVTADGQAKLLDFGIATLLDPLDPTETAPTELALTPEFAAPEQVRGAPVSTATDVYALGVLLYLLLSGQRPYDVRGKPPAEMDRIVCEAEPLLPSVRADAARQGRLRGDLDVIVMKALRKDPAQRYASVQEFHDDIERHLAGRPVRARAQTKAYRALRFVKRHRWSVAAGAVSIVLAVAYIASAAVQQRRITRALAEAETNRERAEQVTEFMLSLFQASEGGSAFADTMTAHDLLARGIERARELRGQPEVRAQMLDAVGHIHMQLGEYERAIAVYEEALAARGEVLDEDHVDVATSLVNIATAEHNSGDGETALRLRRRARDIRLVSLGRDHPATLNVTYWLAYSLHEKGHSAEAWPLFAEWRAGVMAQPDVVTPERATQLLNVSQMLEYSGDRAEAERLAVRALEMRRRIFGPRHGSVARAMSTLAYVHESAGRLEEAEGLHRAALDILREIHPDGHPDVTVPLRSLAIMLHRQRRYDEARVLYDEQYALLHRFYGASHPMVATAAEDLGLVHYRRGWYEEAEYYLSEAVSLYRQLSGPENLLTRRAEVVLGDVLRRRGETARAEPLLLAGYEALSGKQVPGFGYATRIAAQALAEMYGMQGRREESARFAAVAASLQR